MLKAVIFDMDGVIIDSEPMHAQAAVLALKKFNVDIAMDYAYKFIGTRTLQMCIQMIKDFNIAASADELLKANNDMKEYLLRKEGHRVIPYITRLICDLYKHGIKLIIASSSNAAAIEDVMTSLKIRDYFSGFVSGEMTTLPKPAPDIFLKAAQKLGVTADECIVIEDSYNGVMAAKAAGMACIGFANPNSGRQDLSGADYIVEGFDEVDYSFVNQVYSRIHREPVIISVSENLIIRELCHEDIEALCLIRSEPELKGCISDISPDIDIEKDKLRAYINNVYSYYGYGLWGLFLKENERLIGQCGIEYKTLNGVGIYELGYLLAKEYQGKGYAYESAATVVKYGFERLGLDKITAVIPYDNEKSAKLAEKLGMKKVNECIREKLRCHIYEICRKMQ